MPGRFLAQVIGQSEYVQQLVERSAADLSSAGSVLQQGLANGEALAGVNQVLHEVETVIESVTRQLQDAVECLSAVNQSLQAEIRDRTMVDHQLAAAVEQQEGSRRAALHDHLTGLPNRILFRDRLEHGIAQAQRHRWILAVMFLDLDKFKSINDTYGHEAGDVVLQTVAMRLAHTMRNNDTVSRHGGDEFLCVLAPLHDQNDIAAIAAKVRAAIEAPFAVRVGDVVIHLSVQASIGISVFPQDGDSATRLIAMADDAMYGAKETHAGVAFAQANAAEGATTHRGRHGGRLPFEDAAATGFFDGES